MAMVLTPAAAQAVVRMRAEVDEWGRHRNSQAMIASALGISESTVQRVLKRKGAYQRVAEMKTDAEAAASLQKFLRMQEEEKQREADGVVEELSAGDKAVEFFLKMRREESV